jgi:hypothetical protein
MQTNTAGRAAVMPSSSEPFQPMPSYCREATAENESDRLAPHLSSLCKHIGMNEASRAEASGAQLVMVVLTARLQPWNHTRVSKTRIRGEKDGKRVVTGMM